MKDDSEMGKEGVGFSYRLRRLIVTGMTSNKSKIW